MESNPGSVTRRSERQTQQAEPATQPPQQAQPPQQGVQQPSVQPQAGQLPAIQQFGVGTPAQAMPPQQGSIGAQGPAQQGGQQIAQQTPQQAAPQQQLGGQATQQPTGGYAAQPPLAIGVPAQAGATGAMPAQATGTPAQSVGQAGTFQSAPEQLSSQPSEIYPEEFVDHLSEAARNCLDDCIDVSQVAAWCGDRCLEEGAQMAQCSRFCNEASTLGSVTAEFIARDSVNLPAVVDAYIDTAERAREELSNFDSPHTNEAELVLERSIDSSLDMLEAR